MAGGSLRCCRKRVELSRVRSTRKGQAQFSTRCHQAITRQAITPVSSKGWEGSFRAIAERQLSTQKRAVEAASRARTDPVANLLVIPPEGLHRVIPSISSKGSRPPFASFKDSNAARSGSLAELLSSLRAIRPFRIATWMAIKNLPTPLEIWLPDKCPPGAIGTCCRPSRRILSMGRPGERPSN